MGWGTGAQQEGAAGWGGGCKARGQTPGLSRICWYLHHHLSHEDCREDVVGDAEEDAFLQRQGGGRGQLHPRDPSPPQKEKGASRCFLGRCLASPGQW